MEDLFQCHLELGLEQHGEWFYYPFPPVLIISENHKNYLKVLDLLEETDNVQ